MIEKYLYEFGKYLSKENKEEILKEVESNIYDMLDGNQSEENIRNVLKELGSPKKLSLEYRTKKLYLIGPEYFHSYIKTLIFVVILVASILFTISVAVDLIKGPGNSNIYKFIGISFAEGFAEAYSGAISALIWVTIIFVILEHVDYTFDGKNFVKKTEWDPSMLKDVPIKKASAFKRSQLIFEIFFSVFFTSCIIFLAKYSGIYQDSKLTVELFNMNRFNYYAIAIALLTAYLIITNIILIYKAYPNYKLVVLKIIYNLLGMILAILFINDKKLFNPSFKIELANVTNIPLTTINDAARIMVIVITLIIVITTIIEIIRLIYQARNNERKN